ELREQREACPRHHRITCFRGRLTRNRWRFWGGSLYLFLLTIGIGTKPVKVNFWTRLFSGFSGVTSAVYRLPFESTDKWCRVPNCPFPEPHDPNPSRNSSVLRLNTMICAWLRFATYR